MMLIGCDFHPSWQQISWFEEATGEIGEQKLVHATGEAGKFYRQLPAPAVIGTESTGNCQWFVEMATAAGHEVWIGDAAKIRASDVRQQKHDKRDAELLLKLLMEKRFPRIWTPPSQQRDLRQLLIHRYKLVRLQAQAKNGLQHLAMNQGVQRKRCLWSKAGQKVLRGLPLKLWASRRREDLLRVIALLDQQIQSADLAVRFAGATVDDPARCRAGDLAGFRADHGRCFAFSTRQASSQLSRADSARVQFGRTSEARAHQQTG
jgi:transposase